MGCVPTDSETKQGLDAAAPPNQRGLRKGAHPRQGNTPPRSLQASKALPRAPAPPPVKQTPPPAADPPAAPSTDTEDPVLTERFVDQFDRAAIGPDWIPTSPVWRIESGKLCGRNAKNHGVWLKRRLPTNARVEFDALSRSPDGDIKVELWGDGRSAATGTSYTDATSYVAIYGGWKNTFHVLARQNEHAKDRPEVRIDPAGQDLRARKVVENHPYHFKIERSDGKTLRWFVDDIEILSYTDENPLKGEGHDHFAFNDWAVPVCFDNLKITPLGD